MISVPQALGVLFWNDLKGAMLSTLSMATLFVFTYLFGIAMAKGGRGTNI